MTQNASSYASGTNRPEMESISYRRKEYAEQKSIEQKSAALDFNRFVIQTFDDFRTIDAQARREMAASAGEMLRNYDGDSYGEYDQHGNWKVSSKREGEVAYSLPLLKAHIDSAQMIDLRTILAFDYKPSNENSLEQMAIARLLEKYAEKKWKQIWNNEKFQTESLWRLLTGSSIRSFDYKIDPKNPKKKKVPSVQLVEAVTATGKKILKSSAVLKEVDVPQLMLRIDNPLQLQSDLNAESPNESTYWIYRDLVARRKAEFFYKIKFPQTANITPEQKIAYDAQRFGVQANGNLGSSTSAKTSVNVSWSEMCSREVGYFDLEIYGDTMINIETELPNPVKTKTGRVITSIPANTILGDLFDKGLILTVINEVLVNIRHTSKKNYKDCIRYGIRPASPNGSGLKHIKPLAEIVNDSFNFQYSIAQSQANPITLIWRKYLKKIPGFTKAYFVDNLPDNQSLSNLIHVQKGEAANGIVDFIIEKIQGLMQFVAGTFSQNSATPDARMNTATGVAAMTENVNNRILPAIQLRVTADVEARYKIGEFLQEFRDEDELAELADECGQDTVDLFLKCNLRSSVMITVKSGSDQPKSDLMTVNNLTTFANLANSVKDTDFATDFLPSAADALKLPMSIGYGHEAKRQAERRLAMIKEGTKAAAKKASEDQQYAALPPNEIAQEIVSEVLRVCEGELAQIYPEVLILHVENDVFLETYKDWMLSDAAQNANMVLKLAVAQMMTVHQGRILEAPILKAKMADEIEKRANPQPDPAQLAEDAKLQHQDEVDEQIGQEVLARAADEESKDMDSERKMREREHQTEQSVKEKAAEAALNAAVTEESREGK